MLLMIVGKRRWMNRLVGVLYSVWRACEDRASLSMYGST